MYLSCDANRAKCRFVPAGMADNAGEAYECLLCHSALNISSKRQGVHPRNASNADSRCQGWQLPVEDHMSIYTCRTPCFSDLQKASNHKRALAGFMEKCLKQLMYMQMDSAMDVSFLTVISTYLAPINIDYFVAFHYNEEQSTDSRDPYETLRTLQQTTNQPGL